MNGWEATAFWIVCVIPVACLTLVAIGVGLFCWRVIARLESAHRDMLKAVLVLSGQPVAGHVAAQMETTDATEARALMNDPQSPYLRPRRQAQ